MKLKINIPYGIPVIENEDKVSNQKITSNYITMAITAKYAQGLDGQWRRLWGRLQNKIDDAVDTDADSVELEQSELEFIKRSFGDDVKLPVRAAKYLNKLEDALDELSDTLKKKDEKAK